MKTRALKAKDARIVAGILMGNLKTILPELQQLRKEGDKEAVGIKLFSALLADNIEPLWAWLADVGNMTSEQLDDSSLSTPAQIIKAISEDPEAQSFFGQLQVLLQDEDPDEGPGTE